MFISMMSKADGLSECDPEKKKKMDEVSVGAAGSTSVVDLSGDSHLQVETQDLT